MIIIGEKINGAIPSVAAAIEAREDAFIRDLALKQANAGADYLDVCAGTRPEQENEVLLWLTEVVQDATDRPICLDSPDPEVIVNILPHIKNPGLINSVSGEGKKCDLIYPAIAGTEWKVIALTCDDNGIPPDPSSKIKIGLSLIEIAGEYGIAAERIFIDPLVLSISAVNDAFNSFNDAVAGIKAKFPTVKFTSGLSNISYGMPARKRVNQLFLALAMAGGMDSAIMDPLSKDMIATIYATDVLLGRDRHCRKYNKAFRAGLL